MLSPEARKRIEPAREAMANAKRRLEAAWIEWSLVGNPYRDARLLDRIVHDATDVAATARAIADAVRAGEKRR